MTENVIVLGGGDHCRTIMPMLAEQNVLAIFDANMPAGTHPEYGVPLINNDAALMKEFPAGQVQLVNAVGSATTMTPRDRIYREWKTRGYQFLTSVADRVILSPKTTLGEGTQIMPGAMVDINTRTGENCLINAMAAVMHDCVLGDSVHLSPVAILCGHVKIGDCTHVGAGATIIQRVTIGKRCLIGAGAVVTHDIPDDSTVHAAKCTVTQR